MLVTGNVLSSTVVARLSQQRCVHARAFQMPYGERRRRQNIIGQKESCLVLSPTKHTTRPNDTAKERKKLQYCKSEQQLVDIMKDVARRRIRDDSIFGAAFQRCGQTRWWPALMKVEEIRKSIDVGLGPEATSIYCRALSKATRGEKGFGAVEARQKLIVDLTRKAILRLKRSQMTVVVLGSALTVCRTASENMYNSEQGFEFARELVNIAQQQEIPINSICLSELLAVYEWASEHKLLGETLSTYSNQVNAVVLGGLVNVAGEKFDIERVGNFWQLLSTNEFGAQPTALEYSIAAKSFGMCGRLRHATGLVDKMLEKNLEIGMHTSKLDAQLRLLQHHSALNSSTLQQLKKSFQRLQTLLNKGYVSLQNKNECKALCAASEKLMNSPGRVKLDKILIEWNTKRSKIIQSWDNFSAGSNYLQHLDPAQ